MANTALRGAARRVLLASSALIALPGAAQAQAATSDLSMSLKGILPIAERQGGSALSTPPQADPSVVISSPGTPSTILDQGVNGVGQMIIDQKNGFVGLCTGTLINPRTVVFAAHCVNESPTGTAMDPWNYGKGAGQLPIGFGFEADTIAGQRAWFRSNYSTSTANHFYNVNQVVYNAQSLNLGLANNFLQGDVALATFDTPAADVPTWTMLFSPLPAPASIDDTTGTGYHVTMTGYGTNGTGLTGASGGIDYRRRVAENYVGLLGSIDDFYFGLFGGSAGLPANLYQTDFDDPTRRYPGDYNLFKDAALPSEGTTGPGDSGGPLILDRTFNKATIIGVLSGSYTFSGQVSGGYGTTAFYQPLYLYWEYILANNPYRYANTLAGDGKWSDPSHWVTALDPSYQVIVNGQLANGVPTAPGLGIAPDTQNKFGQVCDQEPAFNYDQCYDVKTGITYVDGEPVAATQPGVQGGSASSGNDQATVRKIAVDSAGATAAAGDASAAALPAATLANGLPGATNFVPGNIDPDAATKRSARYYDVTLSAAGTTTLDTAVTIDRFSVAGTNAKLAITSAGSLTSLMAVNQYTGAVQVDGTLSTRGDYFLMSGLLTGSGRINTPFLTSATGIVAPGTMGTIGTLTIGGNLILASGSTLLVDVGPNGTSDRVAVVRNGTTDGIASIGGRVGFAPVAGHMIRYNDLYTIVTAAGGVAGTFQSPSALSAILTPQFVYSANAVQARIVAGTYASVVAATPIQTAFAGLLDRNRASNYNALSGLYGILDLQDAGTIRATLEGLAPRTTPLKYGMGTVATENMSRFYRQHLAGIDASQPLSGTLTMTGQPLQFAALMASDLPMTQATASDTTSTTVREGVLPENVNVFIAGGYVDGDSRSLRDANPFGGRDNFDGFYVVSGIEAKVSDTGVLGFGFGYTKLDGTTGGVGQSARGELFQGTLFAKAQGPGGQVLDAQVSGGVFQASTRRTVAIATVASTLRSRDNALAVSAEVGLGQMFDFGGLQVGPRIAARVNHIGFTPTVETGGDGALRFDRYNLDSAQGRAGLQLAGGDVIKPFASAYYVHDFKDQPGVFTANFIGGTAPAGFRLSSQDQDWAELAAGLSYATERIELSVSADTTVARKDVRNQAYRGAIKFKF
ncbi:autotransporter domain-containing protein [Sphingomonas sp. CD22]|uniref:autotransporter domain-containing protein n=1 Tax=Sphingomonas sp. CD22 TaxID=3100214 RepID=UPI002ADFF013|nr:autotransporter domain-containing protein [Sphingomonas sp. CD22]MEA1085369.1 autotransporter domain-containing protein [Sphingomonas sp. CD22]